MSRVSAQNDAGMSMVELIVAGAISALLLALMANIFGGSLMTQQRAAERTQLTMQLNAATASITESVRSASAIRVSAAGMRLDAKVLALDGTTWSCRAWQIESGALRFSEGANARPTAINAVRAWASLTDGEGITAAGTLASAAAFSQSGARVALGLALTQNDTTVAVTDGAIAQVVQTGGPACW